MSKYRVQCQEITVVKKVYEVNAADEIEARKRVIQKDKVELVEESLISRSSPLSFEISKVEPK